MSEQWEIDRLRPDPRNREIFDPLEGAAFETLAASVRELGVIQPIVATPDGLIIAGEQRWRAARIAGLKTVPVEIREGDDDDIILARLAENVERRTLKPVEYVRAIAERDRIKGKRADGRPAIKSLGLESSRPESAADVARAFGISPAQLAIYRKLADLNPTFLDLLASEDLTVALAYQLAQLKADDQQFILDRFRVDEIKKLAPEEVGQFKRDLLTLEGGIDELIGRYIATATGPLLSEIERLKAGLLEARMKAIAEYQKDLLAKQQIAAEEQSRRAKKNLDELLAEVPGGELLRIRGEILKLMQQARPLLSVEPAFVVRSLLPDELEYLDAYFQAVEAWRAKIHHERSRGLYALDRSQEA